MKIIATLKVIKANHFNSCEADVLNKSHVYNTANISIVFNENNFFANRIGWFFCL